MRSHVVITGTGRAGTTFLVKLLTHLGLNTGYRVDEFKRLTSSISRAGLERNIFDDDCPYIVKNPKFCDVCSQVLLTDSIEIERVFVPVRDLKEAAESRRTNTRKGETMGGLWETDSLEAGAQEAILQKKIYDLILALSKTNIPITFIRYPDLVLDSNYLYEKMLPILADIPEEYFHSIFNSVVDIKP